MSTTYYIVPTTIHLSPILSHCPLPSAFAILSPSMPLPQSEAHRHFVVVPVICTVTGQEKQQRQCEPCRRADVSKLFSLGSSTDTLLDHIQSQHPTIALKRRSAAAATVPATKRPRTEQPSIQRCFSAQNNAVVRPALAELFASCSWAHHCIEWPQFIAALEAYRSSTVRLPSRATLRQDILDLAQQMRASVVGRLRGYCRSYPLTIAIDGWTNVRHDKVTNVMILCGGVAFYWCSIVNVSSRNTALWIHEPLRSVMQEIKQEGLIFSALVADNEQVNKVLHRLLLSTYPFLIRSPCAAHLIQLCVNHALALPVIEPILLGMEELLISFRQKEHRMKLKQVQLAASGNKSYHCLIRPCDTRWSSHLAAARRVLFLRACVDTVLPQTPQFWVDLTEVVRFLEPFETATDVVQTDGSTLYDFYTQFKAILKHVRDTPATSAFYAAKDSITNVIVGVWEKHVSMDAVIISAHLSFDPTIDAAFASKLSTSRRWFTDWAAEYAAYWSLSTTASLTDARSAATLEWSQYLSRAPGSCFEQLDNDVVQIRATYMLQRKRFDPRAVWCLYLTESPILSHAAIALLSVAGSEAAVERSFSTQGTVHSDRRNRMKDAMVEAEMFIRFNRVALRRAAGEVSSRKKVKEMTDDDDEAVDEDASSVAELFRRIEMPEEKQPQQSQQPQPQPQPQQQQQQESEAEELPTEPVVVRIVPRPPESSDDVQRFIVEYVRTHDPPITARFRWQSHFEQRLQCAAIRNNPPMRDVVGELKRKIMKYVRGLAAEEAAEEAAQEAAEESVAVESVAVDSVVG